MVYTIQNEELPTIPLLRSRKNPSSKSSKYTKTLQNYLPITKWLPHYNFHKLQCDIIAGITVGLMVIPQGMAYAAIAGLGPVYGLYCAFMGCFVYFVFGTSKDISIGPTAIMSLIVDQYCHQSQTDQSVNAKYAILLAFLAGIIMLTMGLLKLGFVVRFISIPVISGFTSSAAIIIAFSQVKSLLGLKHVRRKFFFCIYDTFKNIHSTNYWDLFLGCCCILILLTLKKLGRTEWPDNTNTASRSQKVARKIVWLAGTGRNALVVFMSSLVVYATISMGHEDTFTLTKRIDEGLPEFKIPSFSIQTGNSTRAPLDVLSDLGQGLAIVPLIGFLESIAIAKAFGRKNKYRVDASQELIALGLANCFGSFFSSYPVTGSFSRTAVNAQSGVASPGGGIFTGAVVLLALGILTPFFKFIPKASLAALIISSVLTMVEYHIVFKIWKVNKIDLIPLFVTFFGCFYEIEYGILAGIGVSLMIFLYPVIWPKMIRAHRDFTVIKINGDLVYAGMEHATSQIQEASYQEPTPRGFIVDMNVVTQIDFTVTQSLLTLIEDFTSRKVPLFFSGVQDHIRNTMVDSGIDPKIINPCPETLANVNNETSPFINNDLESQ